MSKKEVSWKKNPVAEDYAAALAYLSLLTTHARASGIIRSLRAARTQEWTAKDLLRASRLPLTSPEDRHVAADLKRIGKGKALSPILLVRGEIGKDIALTVADGYHRICAVCHFDEDAPVRCRIVDLE